MDDFVSYLEAVVFPALALTVSLLLTWVAIRVMPRLGFVDHPNSERRIHTKPTPCAGGVAVAAAYFLCAGAMALLHPPSRETLWRFAIPAVILLITGLIDDRYDISAKLKLALQIIAGLAVWGVGNRITELFGLELGFIPSMVVTVFWVVAIVNAFNLIDGLDGVASGLGVVAALCLGAWGFLSDRPLEHSITLFIMGGACLGFLRFNFSPARIFLGDTGAMFIGLFFAYYGLAAMGKAVTMTTLLVPLLAVGVPLLDTALAFWRRLMRRLLAPGDSGIMSADREHIHHRLFDKFTSQRQAALFIYMIAGLFAGAGIAFIVLDRNQPALAYLLILAVVLITVRRLAVLELNASANALVTGLRRPRRTLLFPLLQPFIDLGLITGSYIATRLLLDMPLPDVPFYLWHLLPMALALLVCGTYWTYWLRASLLDYWRTFEWSCIGTLVGLYGAHWYGGTGLLYSVLLGTFTIGTLTGQRMTWRLVGSWVLPALLRRKRLNQEFIPVVMYGGGINCRLFLACINNLRDERPLKIIGIVDDDPALQFFRVYGYPVLGSLDDLEELLRRYHFRKIVVTPVQLEEAKFARLRAFARASGVELIHFEIAERELREIAPPGPAAAPGDQ